MNLIKKLAGWRPMRQMMRSRRGIAATEFALTLPIWATLLLGTGDGAYCLLINERVDRIAYTVTDIVTEYQSITLASLNDIVLAAGQLMQPFTFGNKGIVIISSLYKPAGQAVKMTWQYAGGGSLARNSRIGQPGGAPLLPNGLTLNDNDNVIVSEVYYVFSPLFINSHMFGAGDIYRVAIYKPRLSQLSTPPT